MNVEVQIDIEKLVKDYERELECKLPRWRDRMQAVAEGAIDADDAEHLITVCAAIADEGLDAQRPRLEEEARREGMRDMTPTWDYVLWSLWDDIRRYDASDERRAPAVQNYIRCGEVADRWLVEKAKK
jgi:hypothetical protein